MTTVVAGERRPSQTDARGFMVDASTLTGIAVKFPAGALSDVIEVR